MNEPIERKRLEHKVNGLIFRVSGVFCLLFFIYRLVTFPETLGIGDFFTLPLKPLVWHFSLRWHLVRFLWRHFSPMIIQGTIRIQS